MLSNFGTRKPDKDDTSASTSPQSATTMPPPTPGQSTAPARAPARQGDKIVASMIGPDLTIMGNLISKGEVHIDGEVQGDIHGTHVLIGEKARITGGVVAEDVVVRGQVMGSIRGKKVALQASSHVEGDIFHKTLSIEQGAFFEGKSRRADDPTATTDRAEPATASPYANGAGGPGDQS